MDGLSTAASAIAVVQLTIQLVASIQKISRFLHSFQDAPDEVRSLSESIDLLHQHLDHAKLLVDRQTNLPDHSQSIAPLSNALTVCKARVDRLEIIVSKLQTSLRSQSRIQRKWSSLKVVGKREEINSHQVQIRDADAMLQSAILIHVAFTTTEIHQHLQVTKIAPTQLSPQDPHIHSGSGQALSSKAASLPNKFRKVVETDHQQIYYGVFGWITTQRKSKYLSGNCIVRPENRMTIEEENATLITVPFLQRALEIRLTRSFSHVSRSLTVYSVMPRNSPVFELCRNANIEGLQNLFTNCNISPFVQDTYGQTLVHEAAYYGHGELCAWLCSLGVDPDRIDYGGNLAVEWVGCLQKYLSPRNDSAQNLECSKVLAHSLANASSDKVLSICWFSKSSETLELFLLQDYAGVATSIQSDDNLWKSILDPVIVIYGAQGPEWEYLARSLLRRCYPVHIRQSVGYHGKGKKPDTLLFYLFLSTNTPFEAEEVGCSWLRLLSREGYDVVAYLEEEAALYVPESKIWHSYDSCCRQVVFDWEGTMGVSWEWVNDPTSPILPLQDEFKIMINWPGTARSREIWRMENCNDECWEVFWPFVYETPCEKLENLFCRCLKHLHNEEQRRKRYLRRMEKKAAKIERRHRRKGPRRVPGAWPS